MRVSYCRRGLPYISFLAQSTDPVKVLTVRSTAFEAAPAGEGNATVEKVAPDAAAKAEKGLTTGRGVLILKFFVFCFFYF